MRAFSVFAIAALLAPLAPAAAQGPMPAAAEQQTAPPVERKICRKDPTTSSRIAKRTCRTASEWKAVDRIAGDADVSRLNTGVSR